jgi:hypothetical protein
MDDLTIQRHVMLRQGYDHILSRMAQVEHLCCRGVSRGKERLSKPKGRNCQARRVRQSGWVS